MALAKLARYILVGILVPFGLYKVVPSEAEAIRPLVTNSPLMGWLYGFASTQAVSLMIGAVELAIAALLLAHARSQRAAFAGGVGATLMFLTTLSFLATTPRAYLAPSMVAFLLKDVLLLAAALIVVAEAAPALHSRSWGTRAP